MSTHDRLLFFRCAARTIRSPQGELTLSNSGILIVIRSSAVRMPSLLCCAGSGAWR
jgi:hypothetical protein